MSNNATSASIGSVFGYVVLAVQGIPIQTMFDVFVFGLIGGMAGILGRYFIEFLAKKIFKKSKKDEKQ